MIVFWTEPDYLAVLAVAVALLAWALRAMLRWRRHWRKAGTLSWKRSLGLGTSLALWSVLATMVALEAVFVLFVDHSDAFNGTNVSKRWFRRYIDDQRNDDGYRDRRKLSDPMPPGVHRLVVFGDSFTAGHGLKRMDDRFSERLERALNADGERVWVANLGDPGVEVSQVEALMHAVIDRRVLADVFVYCYMMNDIEGYDPRTEEFLRDVNSRLPTHPLITRTYFINWAYFRWQQLRSDAAVNYFPHLVDSYSTKAWNGVDHKLSEMQQRCRTANIEFRLVLFPFMQELGPNYAFREAHAKLVNWAREHDVPVLDMLPMLSEHRHERLTVNAFDNHPNARAHALIAESLYDWLKDDPRLK